MVPAEQPETLQEPITLDGLTLTESVGSVTEMDGSVTEKGSVEDLFQEPGGVRDQPRNNSRDLPVVAPGKRVRMFVYRKLGNYVTE